MRVLVLYTLPPETVGANRTVNEFDLSLTAQEIASVLPDATLAATIGEAREVLSLLAAHEPDVVFNLCEAPCGRPDFEPYVAALLEWTGTRFTGSGSETLALCRRKDRTNAVLADAGVPVPRLGVLPCIVKPADEDGSAGIDERSVCASEEDAVRARSRIKGLVLQQEFLPGREFPVSLWGRDEPDYVSVGEFSFFHGLQLLTYAGKWDEESADYMNSPLSFKPEIEPLLREQIVAAARGAWRAVRARGYLRVDVRLDNEGVPRVLDVNPNPELSLSWSGVTEAGWTWEDFISHQVEWAL